MKGLIQRVTRASVDVDQQTIAEIPTGLLLLLGVERNDSERQVADLCRKVLSYRVFPDDQGRMNRSLRDVSGSLLVVPQFTLAADTGSGTRPGFSTAASPDRAKSLYLSFVERARLELGPERVGEGQFGADMKVSLVNDGPVTFLLETTRDP
ncbi:MAG: D-aminoacyl-tRNA deacylase [Marinobacter sp.]|uniref:D-aminoacyl-tRNA deacylase n=1 Tax=Marinobacter sp. TaxID=50741 RepID=UPI00299DF977|nr:D-aminoacyl-tRNA deacylase [Marinobacter sp.]MDX1756783.1 D-aminoacyl-tRNA deacylase [Marinobacter sp.]